MLGKNLSIAELAHSQGWQAQPWFDQPFLGVEALGTYGQIHVDTLAMTWLCMLFVLVVCAAVTPRLVANAAGGPGQAIMESIYTFLADLAHGQIHGAWRKFFPLIAAIFMFVLTANFAGVLIPGSFFEWLSHHHIVLPFEWPHLAGEPWEIASPTTDFNVTFGLATVSILVYLGSGFWAHGLKYLKAYLNPIEWLDLIIRPATLALRLMMVITADELMRAAALLMVPVLLPTGVMAFELFIGVIQAFVFTLLTSIYIGLTVSHH